MKLLREVLLIFGIYFIGEMAAKGLQLPIPGNLIGMLLLLVLLCTKVIKLEHVETVSTFLLDHLSFFFIPAGVGLMASFHLIQDIWAQILLLCLVTTICTMVLTGVCVQRQLKKEE